jgi:hypothetical protein
VFSRSLRARERYARKALPRVAVVASLAVVAAMVPLEAVPAVAAAPARAARPVAPEARAGVTRAVASVASGSVSERASAQARLTGKRVEVLAQRTDASQTFAEPNGSFTYTAYAVPQWVRRGSGWVSADASLHAVAGGLAPVASVSPLVLSAGGSGPLATMTVDGKRFSLTWSTALPVPNVSGATATYADVLPGVDLRLTATAAGAVDETLVIKDATAAADPGLAALTLGATTSAGTVLSADAGGNLALKDAQGRVLISSPAPLMWDSSTAASQAGAASTGTQSAAAAAAGAASASSAQGPGARAHTARVSESVSGGRLRLAPPKALLTSRSTVFPVYEDPAFVPDASGSGAVLNYDEVQQGYPTVAEYSSGTQLGVGYQGFSSPTGAERTFYELAIPAALHGATVNSASLNTTVAYAADKGTESTTVGAFSTGPISSSTDWDNQPAKDGSPLNPNYPSEPVSS